MKTPDFYLIQSFLTFSNSRNIVEASEALGISQPAMSAHLKLFSQCFDQDVFLMKGRKKELSAFGLAVFERLSKRFSGVESELHQIQSEFQNPQSAHLRIGGRSEILNHFVQSVQFPGRITFERFEGQAAVQAVQDRRIDLAITNHTTDADHLIAKKAFTDQFVLLINKEAGHLVAKMNWEKRLMALKQVDSIWYRESHPYLKELFGQYKIQHPFQPKVTIANWLTIIDLIRSSLSWSIVPHLYVQNDRNLLIINLDEILDTKMQFFFLFRSEFRKVEWFKEFLAHVQFRQ